MGLFGRVWECRADSEKLRRIFISEQIPPKKFRRAPNKMQKKMREGVDNPIDSCIMVGDH